MFSHIDLKGLASSTQFGYAAGVPFFKDKKKIAFKPGLNILVGPYGSGKSTVLRLLAESTCSFQGGVSAITEHAISQGVDMMAGLRLNGGAGKHKDKLGLKVHHDGQPVVFSDPPRILLLIFLAYAVSGPLQYLLRLRRTRSV